MTARLALMHDLEALHRELLDMGTLTEDAIDRALTALKKQDVELANEVISGDDQIDSIERQVEQRCLNILARHQPLAGDLRTVGAALKVITDLERISDNATDIGEIVLRIAGQRFIKPLVDIPMMGDITINMVRDAITAYINKDMDLAMDVCLRDDTIDNAFSRVVLDVTGIMRQNPDSVSQAVDLMFVAKYLERMADHATNIAEWGIYLVTGTHPQDKDIHEPTLWER